MFKRFGIIYSIGFANMSVGIAIIIVTIIVMAVIFLITMIPAMIIGIFYRPACSYITKYLKLAEQIVGEESALFQQIFDVLLSKFIVSQ